MRTKLLIISCLFANWGFGQIDTNTFRRSVDVTAQANQPLENSLYLKFDSLNYLNNIGSNLTGLFQNQSGVFMKDYGPGQLATPTFRGGDATQTVVLYNGAKINSPTLGSIDFTLIPTSQFSSIGLLSSASSNVYTSGGIGGGVELQSAIQLQQFSFHGSSAIGSFGTRSNQLSVNYPFKLGKIKMALYYGNQRFKAENNFSYRNIFNEPYSDQVRRHSAINVSNQQLNLAALLSANTYVQINTWNTRANRDIPKPINLDETFTQFQNDISNRLQLLVNHKINERHKIDLMLFFDRTVNQYSDSLAGIDNSNDFDNGQLQMTWKWHPRVVDVELFNQVNSSYTVASSKNFEGLKTQLGLGSLHRLTWKSKSKNVQLDFGTRTLGQDGIFELLPFLSAAQNISKKHEISLFGSVSRSARFATLNELYWKPGGNTLLDSEIGACVEVGVKRKSKTQKLNFSAIAYLSQVSNRIRWLPNGATFSPINIAESQNLGIDFNLDHTFFTTQKTKLVLQQSFSLISAKGRIDSEDDYKSLSFIPVYKTASTLVLTIDQLSFIASHAFTAKRFITNDESAYMPSFSLFQFSTTYSYKQLVLGMSVDNVLNTNYQNLPWRPMPGRAFNIQIALRI